MPRALPSGHRHRGQGFSMADAPTLERAILLGRQKFQTWYVDSTVTGGVSGSGDSWGSAFITLQEAINASLPGDLIFVSDSHVQNISAAGTVTVNKAGVKIIGIGTGRRRPTFTWTATAGTWLVSAANVWIENCVFVGEGIDAVVTMMGITADDCSIVSCEFQIGKTSFVPLLGITITGAINRFKFLYNFVHGLAVANCTNFVQIAGGGDGHEFVGNVIKGNFTTTLGCINNITTLCTNIVVVDNYFVNATAAATKTCVFLAGTTGIIGNNRNGIGSGAVPFTASAAHWCGNWSAAAVATDGTLV